jgi:hypothetical protein
MPRCYRGFEATDLIDAFTALERQPASPDADTLTSPPARKVPCRTGRASRRFPLSPLRPPGDAARH